MIIYKIKSFFNPEQFQGWGKRHKYFEGWYFKIINASETKAFAIIPGIAIDEHSQKQAFIQVLNGKQQTSHFYKFDFDEFVPSSGKFKIEINKNSFSEHSIVLNLPGLTGKLEFNGNVGWPKPFYSPGIMGPYAFVPFMECYHGIVSMDHAISGKLTIDSEEIDFENGRGYIEKDWGRSFPSAYLWMQSNHFTLPGISIKASVANIPWIKSSFVGFIAGVWIHDRLIRFTTYNNSSILKLQIDSKKVDLVIENNNYRLEITGTREAASILASPIQGVMNGKIEESMTSKIRVVLTDKKRNSLLLNDTGRNAGLEVAGNINKITS
jgi:tocopherol cyclase